jgi:hypothetical protein
MIKIEVTGNSIPEVADKLLAIGASLRASAAAETPRGVTKVEAEGNAPQKANAVVVTEPAPILKPSVASTDTPAPAALDFDTDVAPHVLALVTRSGKPAAQEILSQFGVEKASLLDPARWPELVAALQDAG